MGFNGILLNLRHCKLKLEPTEYSTAAKKQIEIKIKMSFKKNTSNDFVKNMADFKFIHFFYFTCFLMSIISVI